MEASANPIFAPHMETSGKLSDSMSLSLMSRSAESSESNTDRCYSVTLLQCLFADAKLISV